MQEEIVSKTQKKKAMTGLQQLGATLAELPDTQLHSLGLPVNLLDAILAYRKIRGNEAKRRQMQYVGRLMRNVDAAPIRAKLAALNAGSAKSAAEHQRLEGWRKKLLNDDTALTEFAAAYPDADIQGLRALIRNTRKELKDGKPPRSYRELFRLIKECSTSSPS